MKKSEFVSLVMFLLLMTIPFLTVNISYARMVSLKPTAVSLTDEYGSEYSANEIIVFADRALKEEITESEITDEKNTIPGKQQATDDSGANATLIQHDNGSAENGYAWQYGGVRTWPSYYGCFGEEYHAGDAGMSYPINITEIDYGYTSTTGNAPTYTVNFFVIGMTSGYPDGNKRIWSWDYVPPTPATWSSWTILQVQMGSAIVTNQDFVCGWHPNWENDAPEFYFCMDEDGYYYGRDWTDVAPGSGFTDGWQRTSIAWTGGNCIIRAWVNSGSLGNVVERFEAYPLNNSALLSWETSTEMDLIGFDIFRSMPDGISFIRVNDSMIRAHFGDPEGYVYNYKDVDLENGEEYEYVLRCKFSDGSIEYTDPEELVPGLHNNIKRAGFSGKLK